MVYEWENKESRCYQLYVEERRPLDEVMTILKHEIDFAPSKRAFQTQFKRWDFPSKQSPAHKNLALVERIHQLWETNTTQKDMLRTLQDEGFEIKERELMRVRAKNRWLLRTPNNAKASLGREHSGTKRKREQSISNVDMMELERLAIDELAAAAASMPDQPTIAERSSPGPLSPEIQKKRQERLEKLAAESSERWAAKKRRRRTRGYAGLPADPPGPPRFPSETTLDESKAFLHLNNDLYRTLRDIFQTICEEAGFVKKTQAGPEKWQTAKEKLINDNPHLNKEFWGPPNGVPIESKQLALDVVCMDVTKRMRTLDQRMTIIEAKNALNLNPEQSREIRNGFYEVLKDDHFTSKLEAGPEHWDALKQKWLDDSQLLQSILGTSDLVEAVTNTQSRLKIRAMEVLCRDVMKRLRDDQTKRDPTRSKQVINSGPGPGPARPKPIVNIVSPPKPTSRQLKALPASRPRPLPLSISASPSRRRADPQNDLRIDPSLLLAAADPGFALDQLREYAVSASNSTSASQRQDGTVSSVSQPIVPEGSNVIVAILFRLSPASTFQEGSKIWLGELRQHASFGELRQLTSGRHPGSVLSRIEGVLSDQGDNESKFQIDRDDELLAYMQYVLEKKAAGVKPTFLVTLDIAQS